MNKNLFTWFLYDAGNSFLQTVIGGLYLAQWVVVENGYPDIWYGGTFTLATILVLFLSPLFGTWSDKIGQRLPFVKWLTVLMYFTNLLIVFVVAFVPNKEIKVISVLFLYLIIQTFFQLSLVSYNSLIEVVSTHLNRGKILGIGEGFNSFGWVIGTALLLPFAEGSIEVIKGAGRAQVFLPGLLGFLLLTLPMTLWFKETFTEKKASKSIKEVYAATIQGFKELFAEHKNIGNFLLGFSFVADAVVTIQLYFAIAMEAIFKVTDRQKLHLLILMLIANVIGSYVLGTISDRTGKKKILILSAITLVVFFQLGFMATTFMVLYPMAIFAGFASGGFFTTAKSLLIQLAHKERLGEYFGLFTTFQRFSSILGPLLWGLVTLVFASFPIFKYRAAGTSLVILAFIGVYILNKVKVSSQI